MLHRLFILYIVLVTLTSSDNPRSEFKWELQSSLNFGLKKENWKTETIYFYHSLIEKEDVLGDSSIQFATLAKPLDILDYWGKRQEENYDVFLTKTAYVLNSPVSFFTEERLADINYIAASMPNGKVDKKDSTYHLVLGFAAPDIDYILKFYSDEVFNSKFPLLKDYFQKNDALDGNSSLIVLQHNYNYGRVMFQKTSKMSISISRYYKVDERTLVVNYTLNYIYNMPPGFLGGSDFLIDKIKQGIKALVEETALICEKDL